MIERIKKVTEIYEDGKLVRRETEYGQEVVPHRGGMISTPPRPWGEVGPSQIAPCGIPQVTSGGISNEGRTSVSYN